MTHNFTRWSLRMLKILNLNQTEENPVKQKYKRNKHALSLIKREI